MLMTHKTYIRVIMTSLRVYYNFFTWKKSIYEAGNWKHCWPHVKFSTRPHVKLTLGLILNFNVLCPEQSVYAYNT
jgi:hypothetical protein